MYPHNIIDKYSNAQLRHLENLKRELEVRKAKVANTLYRNKLREHQTKMNYANELHRLHGILSQNDNRLPIGTRERLHERVKHLKRTRS